MSTSKKARTRARQLKQDAQRGAQEVFLDAVLNQRREWFGLILAEIAQRSGPSASVVAHGTLTGISLQLLMSCWLTVTSAAKVGCPERTGLQLAERVVRPLALSPPLTAPSAAVPGGRVATSNTLGQVSLGPGRDFCAFQSSSAFAGLVNARRIPAKCLLSGPALVCPSSARHM